MLKKFFRLLKEKIQRWWALRNYSPELDVPALPTNSSPTEHKQFLESKSSSSEKSSTDTHSQLAAKIHTLKKDHKNLESQINPGKDPAEAISLAGKAKAKRKQIEHAKKQIKELAREEPETDEVAASSSWLCFFCRRRSSAPESKQRAYSFLSSEGWDTEAPEIDLPSRQRSGSFSVTHERH